MEKPCGCALWKVLSAGNGRFFRVKRENRGMIDAKRLAGEGMHKGERHGGELMIRKAELA